MTRWARSTIWLIALLMLPAQLYGQNGDPRVDVDLPTNAPYVGQAFRFTIIFRNVDEYEVPVIPEVDGLRMLGNGPQRQSFSGTTIVNDSITQEQTVSLTYTFVADRAGPLTIPEFVVVANGERFHSEPMDLRVRESDGGGELSLTITSTRNEVFLGEGIPISLSVAIRVFENERPRIALNARESWELLAPGVAQWGSFEPAIVDLQTARRIPASQMITETTDDGEEVRFHVYRINTTIWPTKIGPIDFEIPSVVLRYPTRLRRIFFNQYEIDPSGLRHIAAVANVPDIMVLEPPMEGRPESFNGAVGRFEISADIQPRRASVGDPMTFTMHIRDRSVQPVDVDLVPGPSLADDEQFSNAFNVADEAPRGTVDRDTRSIASVVRPRDDSITEVPPVSFAYFDPILRTYKTLQTDAIPITIDPTTTIAMADVEGGTASNDSRNSPRTTIGARGIEKGDHVLTSHPLPILGAGHVSAFVAPPALVFLIGIVQWIRTRKRQVDPVVRRRERAYKNANNIIRQDDCQSCLRALLTFVEDRCGHTSGTMTAQDVVAVLAKHNVPVDVVQRTKDTLLSLESVQYAALPHDDEVALKSRAAALLVEFDQLRLSSQT